MSLSAFFTTRNMDSSAWESSWTAYAAPTADDAIELFEDGRAAKRQCNWDDLAPISEHDLLSGCDIAFWDIPTQHDIALPMTSPIDVREQYIIVNYGMDSVEYLTPANPTPNYDFQSLQVPQPITWELDCSSTEQVTFSPFIDYEPSNARASPKPTILTQPIECFNVTDKLVDAIAQTPVPTGDQEDQRPFRSNVIKQECDACFGYVS